MYGTPGASAPAELSNNSIAYLGSITELSVWDYDLETNPSAQARAVAYYAGRYPSLVLS